MNFNHVNTITISGTGEILHKNFLSYAMSTSIPLPVYRSRVEYNAANEINRLLNSQRTLVMAIKPLHFQPYSEIQYPNVDGVPLREIDPSRWPKAILFRDLGRILHQLECLQRTLRNRIFSGVETAARKTGAVATRYKTGRAFSRSGSNFCLGDVSLGNLLVLNGRFVLIDFEFAHRTCPGYDIGMLLAELHALREIAQARRAATKLFEGYRAAGGKLNDAIYWRKRFLRYYANKLRVIPNGKA